ncbi:MAG: aryl-sulfate sulfotransferase [Bacteroidota bacterium]
MKNYWSLLGSSLLCMLLIACEKDEEATAPTTLLPQIEVVQNPSGHAPLTALLKIELNLAASLRLRVVGKNGAASDLVQEFNTVRQAFELPLLGLYPDYNNQVELTFLDASGASLATETINIQTEPLIADMPEISIQTAQKMAMAEGWNFVNYFGHNGESLPQRPFFFDAFGDIRWYLDYSTHDQLSELFYDYGMTRMPNGHFIFGNRNDGAIYEINMLGEIVRRYSLHDYGFHHTVIAKPNGNLLVTVTDKGRSTEEDIIMELDGETGAIDNLWDLTLSLDPQRRAWETNLADLDSDWFHANGLAFSPDDQSIIVSGRTQGTVKLDDNNRVVWIVAPHRGWESPRNSEDLQQYLLQPLDANGDPILDPQVLEGVSNHPDFEWPWYQHSPALTANGNLLLFDNGDNRNYGNAGKYSRAVEYEINEIDKTIRQVWAYGKERGEETYSRVVSGIGSLDEKDNILFAPGAIDYNGETYGKVIEIDRQSGQRLFEATIRAPQTLWIISFHNVHRLPIYPDTL